MGGTACYSVFRSRLRVDVSEATLKPSVQSGSKHGVRVALYYRPQTPIFGGNLMNPILVGSYFVLGCLVVACSASASGERGESEGLAIETSAIETAGESKNPNVGCRALKERVERAARECIADADARRAEVVLKFKEARKHCAAIDPRPSPAASADPPPEFDAADLPPAAPSVAELNPERRCRGLRQLFDASMRAHRRAADGCRETRRKELKHLAEVCATDEG